MQPAIESRAMTTWRGNMIKRGFANYNERTGKCEWGEQASRRH